jgi:hypothetical protein
MKPWLMGAKANWPNDDAAVATPKISERFSVGTDRPNAAMTTEKEQMAIPTPVMIPAVIAMMLAVGENAMAKTPSA